MNIIKVSPRGFCLGVVKSIKIAKDTIKLYPDKNIYMIGMLVHNKIIVNELNQLGIQTLDDWKIPRDKLIDNLKPGDVVIFSAHGTSSKIINKAKKMGLIVVDTKCEWVEITENLINNKIKENYDVIFIGKHEHPETIALTAINSDKIHLITNLQEAQELNINSQHIFATNQTTLSIIDTENIYNYLKTKYPTLELKNDICQATFERQQAIMNLKAEEIDLLLVVGDKRSNNTLKLVELGMLKKIPTYRINELSDIKEEWIKDIKTVAVTAGASTSSIVQNDVIKFLESK